MYFFFRIDECGLPFSLVEILARIRCWYASFSRPASLMWDRYEKRGATCSWYYVQNIADEYFIEFDIARVSMVWSRAPMCIDQLDKVTIDDSTVCLKVGWTQSLILVIWMENGIVRSFNLGLQSAMEFGLNLWLAPRSPRAPSEGDWMRRLLPESKSLRQRKPLDPRFKKI